MPSSRPVDTDESAIPAAMRAFLRNRCLEALGLTILAVDVGLVLSLATWSALDTSLQEPYQDALANWMGRPGAAAADVFLHTVGLGVIGFIAAPTFWSLGLITHEPFARPLRRLMGWLVSIFALAGFLAILPPPSGWPLLSGLGGRAGDVISASLLWILSFGLKGAFATIVSLPLLALAALWGFALAINRSELTGLLLSRVLGERGHDMVDAFVGALAHWIMTLGSAFGRSRRKRREIAGDGEDEPALSDPRPGLLRRCLKSIGAALARARANEVSRVEPRLSRKLAARKSKVSAETRTALVVADGDEAGDPEEAAEESEEAIGAAKLVSRNTKPIKQAKRLKKDSPQSLIAASDFELPPLTLLSGTAAARPRRRSER